MSEGQVVSEVEQSEVLPENVPMIEKEESSTIKTAYGKTLPEPIPYTFRWAEFPNFAVVVKKEKQLTQDEQVKVRNVESKANARQKALQKALDDAGYKAPTLENDEQLRLKTMLKVLMADGKTSEADAREKASLFLGIAWAE